MTERRRRLIEVAFPLEEVSAHSRREKNITFGHISTLHLWWARRPLAACRAFIYASLVDDPGDDAERDDLLKEVADLASWDAVRHPERVVRSREDGGSGLAGAQLLERAQQRILDSNDGERPQMLDPFAGGGAIPLEALRLGCEVEASDLNPVAALILKCTVEYPQKYGRPDSRPVPAYIQEGALGSNGQRLVGEGDLVQEYLRNPLVADVRYWGMRMLARARAELGDFYPPDPDGSKPVAYLWSRTIPCPNCGAEMPLVRQYWLARGEKRKTALNPVVNRDEGTVSFRVVDVKPDDPDPARATTSRGDTECLVCRQVVKNPQAKEIARDGRMSARLMAVVLQPSSGGPKVFREPSTDDEVALAGATAKLRELAKEWQEEFPLIPDEPVAFHPQYMLVREWGLDEWGKLFNPRQVLTLAVFSRLVRIMHDEILQAGIDDEYAKAIATYLGILVDKIALRASTCGVWHPGRGTVENIMGDGTLPMTWDYPEAVLIGDASGGAGTSLRYLSSSIEQASRVTLSGQAHLADARTARAATNMALTDPPYYDAINYADLSDFFYVWLKRSVGFLYPEIMTLPLTPKDPQIVMNVYTEKGSGRERSAAAREAYVRGMSEAFAAMRRSIKIDGLAGIVFAHTDPDAWATLIEGMLSAGFVPDASWPIDSERQTGSTKAGKAKLKTSVWMACRPREADADEVFLGDLLAEMRGEIRDRLLDFWARGIRGADFFISAIGPALGVYGRHSRVLRPDGTEVTVRDFLDFVRRESTQVALEQVLGGADLGSIDPVTRQYVTWVWSYSRASLDAGEAIALCLATGSRVRERRARGFDRLRGEGEEQEGRPAADGRRPQPER